MKDYKGSFKGKELSYIREVLSSDFKAKSSGTMNERLNKILKYTINVMLLQQILELQLYTWL